MQSRISFTTKDIEQLPPHEKQERAARLVHFFTDEAINFFKQNPSEKLAPLHPSNDQVNLLYFLLSSSENGTLIEKTTEGKIQESPHRPYLASIYEASEAIDEHDGVPGLVDPFDTNKVSFVLRWDVNTEFPLGFTIFGKLGTSMPGAMDFITLPEKPSTHNQIDKHLGIIEGKDISTGVYQRGERFILSRKFVHQGKEYTMTDQYYLVGVFEGDTTDKTYWVYGSNHDRNHTMTIRESVGALERALESKRV